MLLSNWSMNPFFHMLAAQQALLAALLVVVQVVLVVVHGGAAVVSSLLPLPELLSRPLALQMHISLLSAWLGLS
jgi:hypothetical protein